MPAEPETVRIFVAVKVRPTSELRKIINRLAEFGQAVKPVSEDQLHITLKFLGDVFTSLIPDIITAMRESVNGVFAGPLRILGLGAFPRLERPAVIWAGIENSAGLIGLAEELEQHCETFGFSPEERAFHPHLTLARIRKKPPEELSGLFSENTHTELGTVEFEAIHLFRSELLPTGPRYTVLESVEISPSN
jgi:RNA 2',3'-cyclic 3'-phosphodiesterase